MDNLYDVTKAFRRSNERAGRVRASQLLGLRVCHGQEVDILLPWYNFTLVETKFGK